MSFGVANVHELAFVMFFLSLWSPWFESSWYSIDFSFRNGI